MCVEFTNAEKRDYRSRETNEKKMSVILLHISKNNNIKM